MPRKVFSQPRKSRFRSKFKTKRSKTYQYRHISKLDLVRKYEELKELGVLYYQQFEDLRIEYLTVRDKCSQLIENNRDLAARNAALLHENETLQQQISKIHKEHLIKVTAANLELKNKLNDIQNDVVFKLKSLVDINNPLMLLQQDYEHTLSIEDITHLEEIPTRKNSRIARKLSQQKPQERLTEKINELYSERINLTAMLEEPSPISNSYNLKSISTLSSKKDGSTFDVPDPLSNSSICPDNRGSTSNRDRPINSTMIETPSFRRIIPKTPTFNQACCESSSSSADDSDWEYNSERYKAPAEEPRISTSLDSIQNFEPKTPSFGKQVETKTQSSGKRRGRSSVCPSSEASEIVVNRQSVAYPEKTPERSPLQATSNIIKARRLLSSSIASKDSLGKENESHDQTNEDESSLYRRSKRPRKNINYRF